MKQRTIYLFSLSLLLALLALFLLPGSQPALRFLAKFSVVAIVVCGFLSITLGHILGPEKTRLFWIKSVMLSASLLGTLVLAEFAVRFLFQDVSTTADNSSYFARRWYERHPPAINSLGFREREITQAAPSAAYRIAVVGDSFTYGQGILEEERFTNRIQVHLDKTGGRYEVFNFGRPGAETDDHVDILDDAVIDLDPDFVLLQWFINDVEVSDSGRPVPFRLIPSDFARAFLHAHSALYYLVDSRWKSLQVSFGLTESYLDNMRRRFRDPSGSEPVAAREALLQFVSRLNDEGISFGIVLFPMMVAPDGDVNSYPLGFLMDRVLDFCDEHGIRCLDMRPVFANVESTSGLWASRLDRHPGAEANRLAAKAILETFAPAWGLLDKAPTGQ